MSNKGKQLISNLAKRAGYVRGFFPELLDHATMYSPDGVGETAGFLGRNGKNLALLSLLAAGGYYLWNKNKEHKEKAQSDDDRYYTHVPGRVMTRTKGRRGSSVDYDNYAWDSEEPVVDSEYDEMVDSDIPTEVLADRMGFRRTNSGAMENMGRPKDDGGNTIVIKTSSAKVNSVKDWLYS